MNKDEVDEIVRAHTTGAMSTHWDKCYLTHPRCALHLLASELKYAMFAINELLDNCSIDYDCHEGHESATRAGYLVEKYKGRLPYKLAMSEDATNLLKNKWEKFEQEMRDGLGS